MTWTDLLRHYLVLYARVHAHGVRQEDVAARGGLPQNTFSRMLRNDQGAGPSVETFLRALEGVGYTPAEFFAELEGGHYVAAPGAPTPNAERERALAQDRRRARAIVEGGRESILRRLRTVEQWMREHGNAGRVTFERESVERPRAVSALDDRDDALPATPRRKTRSDRGRTRSAS